MHYHCIKDLFRIYCSDLCHFVCDNIKFSSLFSMISNEGTFSSLPSVMRLFSFMISLLINLLSELMRNTCAKRGMQ